MKKKCFTLVELLVVIAVIALLMGLLMPALARVRQIAHRMICGSNLASIGKGCLIYAQDHDEEFPRGGLSFPTEWGPTGAIADCFQKNREQAYGKRGTATVTSALYHLVKYTETTPKSFNCRGDEGTKEFALDEVEPGTLPSHIKDITDAWDFGDEVQYTRPICCGMYNSYSYHLPYDDPDGYQGWPVTAISSPESPLAADRNPFLDKNANSRLTDPKLAEFDAEWASVSGREYYSDTKKKENSAAHQWDGQNVLFQDGHVSFERYPNCGIRKDNIWKFWADRVRSQNEEDWQVGKRDYEPKKNGDYGPKAEEDAYLVSEVNVSKESADKWGRQ